MDDDVPNKKGTIKDKKGTFDLDIAVLLKEIFRSYGKQYRKYEVRMCDFEKVEKYLSEFTGIDFNFVLTRRLEEALAQANKEIEEHNGDN